MKYDLIVVGAGPAGLTSALYALRANKKVLVLEEKSYGGQIVNASKIENYPGIAEIDGFSFATNLYNQVKNLGGIICYEKVIDIKQDRVVITNKNSYNAKAIIIASGVLKRKLGIDKEEEFVGSGVSYCATCDGRFYKDKVVAVIGGGNTAIEEAIYLSDLAKKVYLIHRRDTFKSEDKYVGELKEKKNVEFILNANVISLNGDGKLESITVKDVNGARDINVDGVFIAVGQVPNNEAFKNVVDLDSDGYIITLDDVHTKTKGVYAAGDARCKYLRQLTTAVGDGALAASVAIKEMEI